MFTTYAVTLFRFTWIILRSYFYYIQYSITRDFSITCPTYEATTISYFVIIFKTLIWLSLPIPKLKERVKRDTAKPIGDVYQNLKKEVKRNTAKPIGDGIFCILSRQNTPLTGVLKHCLVTSFHPQNRRKCYFRGSRFQNFALCLARFRHFSREKHQYCDNNIHLDMKVGGQPLPIKNSNNLNTSTSRIGFLQNIRSILSGHIRIL